MGKVHDVDPALIGTILDAIPEFVVVIDREGVITYVNRVEPGYDRDEVIGMQASAIVAAESLAVFQEALDTVLSTGGEEQYEAMVSSPSGTPQWYRSRMVPLRRDGEIVAALLQATNVSELKVAHERIDKLRQLLPMCSWCDRIQDGEGEWESIESYIERHSHTKISHGLCPACFQRQLDGLADDSGHGGDAA